MSREGSEARLRAGAQDQDECKGALPPDTRRAGASVGASSGAGAGAGAGAPSSSTGAGAGAGPSSSGRTLPAQDLSLVFGVHVPGFFVVRRLGGLAWGLVEPVLGPILGTSAAPPPARSAEATRFLLDFAERYAGGNQERCPRFVEQSFRAAVAAANRQSKPLLVYLHSGMHPDTDKFCRETLCEPTVVDYLRQNFAVWGGTVTSADGYDTMSVCQVTSFPHVAIYIPSSQRNQYQKLWSREGPATAQELKAQLMAAMAAGAEHVGRIVAQRVADEEDRRLRQEQEQAYRESEARDRAKEAAKQEAAEKEAVEEAKQLSVQLAREADLERARNQLPPEPAHGGKTAESVPTTVLRFTLPSGTRVQRRFKCDDTIDTARCYVLVTLDDMGEIPPDIDVNAFEMSTTFPKRTFGNGDQDLALTLEEAGLSPQGVLFVSWQ